MEHPVLYPTRSILVEFTTQPGTSHERVLLVPLDVACSQWVSLTPDDELDHIDLASPVLSDYHALGPLREVPVTVDPDVVYAQEHSGSRDHVYTGVELVAHYQDALLYAVSERRRLRLPPLLDRALPATLPAPYGAGPAGSPWPLAGPPPGAMPKAGSVPGSGLAAMRAELLPGKAAPLAPPPLPPGPGGPGAGVLHAGVLPVNGGGGALPALGDALEAPTAVGTVFSLYHAGYDPVGFVWVIDEELHASLPQSLGEVVQPPVGSVVAGGRGFVMLPHPAGGLLPVAIRRIGAAVGLSSYCQVRRAEMAASRSRALTLAAVGTAPGNAMSLAAPGPGSGLSRLRDNLAAHDLAARAVGPTVPPGTDLRTLSILRDEAGSRFRDLSTALAHMSQDVFADWPLEGPRSVLFCLKFFKSAGLELLNHHARFRGLLKGNADSVSWDFLVQEHGLLVKIASLALTYDQLNLPDLAAFEVLFRRVQQIEDRLRGLIEEPGELVSTDKLFLGYDTGRHSICLSPELQKFMGEECSTQSKSLEAQRKAREERALLSSPAPPAKAGGRR
jgi:hypothetical protein